jgi:hypothetical protein
VVSFTSRPLYHPGKSSCYPFGRRLGGPHSRSGHCGEEEEVANIIGQPDRPGLQKGKCKLVPVLI